MTLPLRLAVRRSGALPSVRVSLTVPSTVDIIEETVELVALHAFAGCTPASRTLFRLRVAVAEALANAMLAGNHGDTSKKVIVELLLTEHQVQVRITDEGIGFLHTETSDPTLPDALEFPSGRGLFLIHQLTDHVEFNPQGNSIWMTLPRS